ncbi:C39 family peptidase [Lactiplantibacillus plajomi]|uniref:C39 family peptidase n=1 Tax=Lactiplantibacillus plajomi TaxID=1457217 RepID=A0ABV6K3L4_9LACO|nr:C39 family peptidase [Lactiplantibacillus plajomi]
MPKQHKRSLRGRIRLSLVIIVAVVLMVMGVSAIRDADWIDASFSWAQRDKTAKKGRASKSATKNKQTTPAVNRVLLDVPLVNQMTAPRLYNGCEITSLTMMMNYYGINVSKNTLADRLTSVPLTYDNGQRGNPNVGFVGDVTGANPGLGVYHTPIYKVAKTETSQVKDLSGASFKQVVKQLEAGRPVWTVTTTSFAPVNTMETWDTPQGDVKVTYDVHSVVIVGFDRKQKKIYVNNPYGQKQQAVDWDNFVGAYNQMGQQAIVLTLNHNSK